MLLNTIGLQRTPAMTRSKEEPMTSPKDATPPTEARLPTPAERPTWVELVNQERRLLDGLVQFWRARSRHPPADVEKIVARALEEALQECIAEEKDDERADECAAALRLAPWRPCTGEVRAWSTPGLFLSRPKPSSPAPTTNRVASRRLRASKRC
jgi:hypothetical protein